MTLLEGASYAGRRKHYVEAFERTLTYGQAGASACSSAEAYDQAWHTADAERYDYRPVTVADLPLCKRCERITPAGQRAVDGAR